MGQDHRSSIQIYNHKGWTVQIGNKRITRRFEKQVIYHCTKSTIKKYWCERFDIDIEHRDSIDWKVLVKATTEMSATRRLFITKHRLGYRQRDGICCKEKSTKRANVHDAIKTTNILAILSHAKVKEQKKYSTQE